MRINKSKRSLYIDVYRKIIRFFSSPPLIFVFSVISLLGFIGFYKTFSFWFYRGWEASWFFGITGRDYSIINLMKSHGFVYYFNYIIFGWSPKGWFITAVLFHILTTCLIIYFIDKVLRNRSLSFASGLLFIVTTAHHDVITWGTFESLYSVQTGLFFISLIMFYYYRTTKNILLYLFSLIIFTFAIMLRESGLLFIPILFLADISLFHNTWKTLPQLLLMALKNKKSILLTYIPFIFITALYLLIRVNYGGSAHDFIDERVQFRILLLKQHRYIEYIYYGLVSFGQFIPPYFIPYPILNKLREIIYVRIPVQQLYNYFFVFFGWGFYAVMLCMYFLQKKSKYKGYLIFSLTVFTIVTLFYSYAWSLKPSFLPIPYSWSENRWRYLAFSAFAPFITLSVYSISKAIASKNFYPRVTKHLLAIFVTFYIAINLLYLHKIEDEMYIHNSLPSIRFYNTFLKRFSSIPKNTVFYVFGGTAGLNDFMAELQLVRSDFYPEQKNGRRDWIWPEMYSLLENVKKGNIVLSDAKFIDFSPENGVLDKTERAINAITSAKPVSFVLERPLADARGIFRPTASLLVDIPHKVIIRYAIPGDEIPVASIDSEDEIKVESAYKFSNNLFLNRDTIGITDCKTRGPFNDVPFHYLGNQHLLDGNIQYRSVWWSDCRPAWVIMDLKNRREVSGFSWTSINGTDGVPLDYHYDISNDGKEWTTVYEVNNNTQASKIDKFPRVYSGRYIRFFVSETSERTTVKLNELTPVFADNQEIFVHFSSQIDLYNTMYESALKANISLADSQNQNNRKVVWIPFYWHTNPSNSVAIKDRTFYIPFIIDGKEHTITFEIPESDRYSNESQFMERTVKSVELPNYIAGFISELRFDPMITL